MTIRNKVGELFLSIAKFVINTLSVEGVVMVVFVYQLLFTLSFLAGGLIAVPLLMTEDDTFSNILSLIIISVYLLIAPVYVTISALFYNWFTAILRKISRN